MKQTSVRLGRNEKMEVKLFNFETLVVMLVWSKKNLEPKAFVQIALQNAAIPW